MNSMLNEARAQIRGDINQTENKILKKSSRKMTTGTAIKDVGEGDVVELSSGIKAQVVSGPDKDGVMKLQAGRINLTAKISEIIMVHPQKRGRKIRDLYIHPKGCQKYRSKDRA